MVCVQTVKTSIGYLKVSASETGISKVDLLKEKPIITEEKINQHTKQAIEELQEYFRGTRKEFTVNVDWEGYSDFYKSVWSYLVNIPFGQTRSYGDIAKYLENPGASRAVGLANGKNPILIIVPCHRVIGSNGSLTGFASGVDIKQQLLFVENPERFAIQGNLF